MAIFFWSTAFCFLVLSGVLLISTGLGLIPVLSGAGLSLACLVTTFCAAWCADTYV
jgi:hypothetical protein